MSMQCREWYAWLNTMPPGPHKLIVTGDVLVGNPGIEALLTMHEPQGINPAILLLDLNLVQKPGMWPQVMTCASARFDRLVPPGKKYTSVTILTSDGTVAEIKVEEVS